MTRRREFLTLGVHGESATSFRIPAAEFSTQTTIVYGAKGMGKTNLIAVAAEELEAAGERFAVLDPIGVSWGLRHPATKSSGAGLPILILGGVHGDLPIEPTAGAVVAEFVVDESQNVVIDISRRADGRMWGQGEKLRFVTAYLNRLYEKQGERRRPLLQIIDEAGRFAPENAPKGAVDVAACIGALEQIVELGRNVGVGVMLTTQRSARMKKSVSELAECLVAFRTIGPRSNEAVIDWFGAHVDRAKTNELVAELRTLERGSALVVSPGWLKFEGVVHFRGRRTFDSSATPTSADKRRAAAAAPAPARLAEFRAKLAETVARAELDDPRKLRERVIALERELDREKQARKTDADKASRALEQATEGAVVAVGLTQSLANVTTHIRAVLDLVDKIERNAKEDFDRFRAGVVDAGRTVELAIANLKTKAGKTVTVKVPPPLRSNVKVSADVIAGFGKRFEALGQVGQVDTRRQAAKIDREFVDGVGLSADGLGAGERRVLAAVAIAREQGTTRAGISVAVDLKKSTRDLYLQRLTRAGLVEVRGGRVFASPAGLEAVGDELERIPTGRDLVPFWRARLSGGELAIFDAVVAGAREREALGAEAGLKKSTRDLYVQRLIRREILVADGPGRVTLAPAFGA